MNYLENRFVNHKTKSKVREVNTTASQELEADVHQFAHYNTKTQALYVYNNAGKMYKLDGEQITILDRGL